MPLRLRQSRRWQIELMQRFVDRSDNDEIGHVATDTYSPDQLPLLRGLELSLIPVCGPTNATKLHRQFASHLRLLAFAPINPLYPYSLIFLTSGRYT